MSTQAKPRTARRQAAAPVETAAARHARLLDDMLHDQIARHQGYLTVFAQVSRMIADNQTVKRHTDRQEAQILAALLHVRVLVQAEMERTLAEVKALEAFQRMPADAA